MASSELLKQLEQRWLTGVLIVGMSALWLYHFNRADSLRAWSYNYDDIDKHGQWYRLLAAAITHVSAMHVLFNMYALWQLSWLEEMLGTMQFAKDALIILLGSQIMHYIIDDVLIRYGKREERRQTTTVGFSGVVFGLQTVMSLQIGGNVMIFGFSFPTYALPFLSLMLTQIIVRNASFIGHLCGIVVGAMVGVGFFVWFDSYIFWCTLFMLALSTIYNLRFIANVRIPGIDPMPISNSFLDLDAQNASNHRVTIVNGSVEYNTVQQSELV